MDRSTRSDRSRNGTQDGTEDDGLRTGDFAWPLGDIPQPALTEELLRHCLEAVALLPSCDVRSGSISEDPKAAVQVEVTVPEDVNWETVRADLKRVWKAEVVRTRTSLHVICRARNGFDFRFSILGDGHFLTGIILVRSVEQQT